MQNFDQPDKQTTPPPPTEKKRDLWRKYRILAGILTCYVGLKAGGLVLLNVMLSRTYGFLSGILGGRGGNPNNLMIGPGDFLVPAIIALPFFIGGILFCRKKRSGSVIVWIAALLSLPISLLTIYLQLYMPGTQPDISFMPVLYSLLISVYLIWVLRKTSPAKDHAPPKTPSKRAIIVLVGGIAMMFIGYVAWDYFMVQESALINKIQFDSNAKEVYSLLESGADPNQRTKSGTTALVLALERERNSEFATALLEYGADPNVTSRLERPELSIEYATDRNRANEDFEHTPLVLAMERHFVEVAELMIEKGADVNPEKANELEESPIVFAIDREHAMAEDYLRLVRTLLDKGAILSPDILVQSFAAGYGSVELLALLIEHGADVNAPRTDNYSSTALMEAAKTWNVDKVKLLMEHGADPHQISGEYTPIQYIENMIEQSKQKGWEVQDYHKAMLRQLRSKSPD